MKTILPSEKHPPSIKFYSHLIANGTLTYVDYNNDSIINHDNCSVSVEDYEKVIEVCKEVFELNCGNLMFRTQERIAIKILCIAFDMSEKAADDLVQDYLDMY